MPDADTPNKKPNKNTAAAPAVPKHGGSWKQDPKTGKLVLVSGNKKTSIEE